MGGGTKNVPKLLDKHQTSVLFFFACLVFLLYVLQVSIWRELSLAMPKCAWKKQEKVKRVETTVQQKKEKWTQQMGPWEGEKVISQKRFNGNPRCHQNENNTRSNFDLSKTWSIAMLTGWFAKKSTSRIDPCWNSLSRWICVDKHPLISCSFIIFYIRPQK